MHAREEMLRGRGEMETHFIMSRYEIRPENTLERNEGGASVLIESLDEGYSCPLPSSSLTLSLELESGARDMSSTGRLSTQCCCVWLA